MDEKYVDLYFSILSTSLDNEKRNSSLINSFYDISSNSSQSLSIKTGNVIEKFFNQVIEESTIVTQLLKELNFKKNNYYIGEHQVDLLFLLDNVVYHREIKTNLDLDNGKKRDIINREKEIVILLSNKYPNYTINSGILNPLLVSDHKEGKLGTINGINWICDIIQAPFTSEEFLLLGRHSKIQTILKEKGYK